MQDRAPEMHERLKREGLLEQELSNREEMAREAMSEMNGEALTPVFQNPSDNILVQASRINQVMMASWEQALALAIDFPAEADAQEPPTE